MWEIEQIHVRIYEGRVWHISPNGLFLVKQAHLCRARMSRQPMSLAMLDPLNMPLVLYSFSQERTYPASFSDLVERISQNLPPRRYRFTGDALTAVEFRGAIHQHNHDASSRDIFGCSKNRQNRIVENSTYPLDDFGFR